MRKGVMLGVVILIIWILLSMLLSTGLDQVQGQYEKDEISTHYYKGLVDIMKNREKDNQLTMMIKDRYIDKILTYKEYQEIIEYYKKSDKRYFKDEIERRTRI
jgi:hypothetical protein